MVFGCMMLICFRCLGSYFSALHFALNWKTLPPETTEGHGQRANILTQYLSHLHSFWCALMVLPVSCNRTLLSLCVQTVIPPCWVRDNCREKCYVTWAAENISFPSIRQIINADAPSCTGTGYLLGAMETSAWKHLSGWVVGATESSPADDGSW